MHTGWSSTHCRSCGDGMNGQKPSFLACATSSPHRCSQKRSESSDRNRESGKTNGIDRLPCGYLYRSRHWISKSMSSLHPCCHHRGGRLFMVHIFDCYPWALFELMQDVNVQNKSRKWLMVSGRSMILASKQTYTRTASGCMYVYIYIIYIYYYYVCTSATLYKGTQ